MIKEPYYTLEVAARACYFEILVNDVPVFSMEITGQVGPMVPINFAITKSGSQNLTAKVLPLPGENILNEAAMLNFSLKLFDVSNDEFKLIETFDEEQAVKENEAGKTQISVYNSQFFAQIPYEMKTWEKGISLNDVDKADEKLRRAYDRIAKLLNEKKFTEFSSLLEARELNMAKSLYLNPASVNARINSLIEDVNAGFEVMPLAPDASFRIYGFGKLACLKKLNGEPALFLYNYSTNEELMLDLMFYIPEGKTEFEVI